MIIGAGSLAAASATAGFLLPAATAGCVRAGGGRQPQTPASLAGQRCRWRVGPGDAQPHSKGGHLENLAVAPSARGRGIGQQLVQALLQAVGREGSPMVSLTTRIPRFFSPFGFQPCGQLADGSTAMLILLPSPAVSEPLTQ